MLLGNALSSGEIVMRIEKTTALFTGRPAPFRNAYNEANVATHECQYLIRPRPRRQAHHAIRP